MIILLIGYISLFLQKKKDRMDKVDMTYSFHSMEEPTEEQLKQLMREACEDAVAKGRAANEAYFAQLSEMIKSASSKFDKEHGKS